ncbi:MAG: hypothetical protein Q7T55_24380 [Solirubrobacteraceae bacterium]|nr:hypothetical protein [Solirubrobacteraceae bacterium]
MSADPRKRSLAERIFGPVSVFALFTTTGILHLAKPGTYEQIMPPQLPAPHELVIISGVAEIVGGALFLFPRTRRFGAWYLIALLIAVFPSNVYMASQEKFHKMVPGGEASLIARLPIQFLMIWWLHRLAKRTSPSQTTAKVTA